MEDFPRRKWLRHEIPPNVTDPHPFFFLTICCQTRQTNQLALDQIWPSLLESVTLRNQSGIWNCTLFLAMPDHVHSIIRFDGSDNMKGAIAAWKKWTSRQLNIEWQSGFFDHRLRNEANAMAKRRYILANPVRANLVEKPSDWPFLFDAFPHLNQ